MALELCALVLQVLFFGGAPDPPTVLIVEPDRDLASKPQRKN
jgi:hypothetical protein